MLNIDALREHVFISYHFSCQKQAIDIRNRLKEAGFKVWIDIDDMCMSVDFFHCLCLSIVTMSLPLQSWVTRVVGGWFGIASFKQTVVESDSRQTKTIHLKCAYND